MTHTYISFIGFATFPSQDHSVIQQFDSNFLPSLSLYCAGFLCMLIALSPPVADQIKPLNQLFFLFLPTARMHTWQGADWHHLTSLCFLISILTVYQKRNWFGGRVLSACMSLCVSKSFFFFSPRSLRSYRSLHRATWNCLVLVFTSLSWEDVSVDVLPVLPGLGYSKNCRAWCCCCCSCLRTNVLRDPFALPRASTMTQLQFKDAFWVSELSPHVSSIK